MELGWVVWSAVVWLCYHSAPKTASLPVQELCCQHLKQHMLLLGPSATKCDGEKEVLECEVLLSVLWICLYIMLITLDLNLGHHSLESWSGDQSSGGMHKGSEIWEAVQRSERMLRHRWQLGRKKSAFVLFASPKKGKERISGEIYLQTLLIGTWKECEVFLPSISADSCSLPVLEVGSSDEAREFFLLFWPLSQYFRNTVACVEYLNFSESNKNWCSGRLLWDQPKQRKLCTQC